jgi:hypothetical protein
VNFDDACEKLALFIYNRTYQSSSTREAALMILTEAQKGVDNDVDLNSLQRAIEILKPELVEEK